MCYYSMMEENTRRAIEGESLVFSEFRTGARGFASESKPGKGVCLTTGTRLILRELPAPLQKKLRSEAEAEAEFHEISPGLLWMFRAYDVLIFQSGKRIPVSNLPIGIRADVLHVPGTPGTRLEELEREPALAGRETVR
jgi:hypothetical protein